MGNFSKLRMETLVIKVESFEKHFEKILTQVFPVN